MISSLMRLRNSNIVPWWGWECHGGGVISYMVRFQEKNNNRRVP